MKSINEELSLKPSFLYVKYGIDDFLMEKRRLEGLLVFYKDNSVTDLYYSIVSKVKRYVSIKNLLESLFKDYSLILNNCSLEMYDLILEDINFIKNKVKAYSLNSDVFEPKINNVIVEVRSGIGGAEASLFADLLYKMYLKYSLKLGCKVKTLNLINGETGGLKQIYLSISGHSIYNKFKYESGIHRIQRIPSTESNGRVHTSTATVAVLPEAEEVELKVEDKDLKITVCRSSGPGGQGVNTTDSSVQILHKPTGIIVTCSNQRTQQKNKSIALNILKAKLLFLKKNEIQGNYSNNRKVQISKAERSNRIRTYNFLDNRITDHRINFTTKSISSVLNGNLDILTEHFLKK
jgi:peptide chain release factor 1